MANIKRTEEERLLDLFNSRAEIKKQYTELQSAHLLQSRVNDEQAQKIKQLENDLKQLEQHLTNPDNYRDIQVYYQLRKLWNTCNLYVHKFRDRLVDQQKDRDRKQQLMEFNQERTAKLDALNVEIEKTKKDLDKVSLEVEKLSSEIDATGAVAGFLKRQRLGQHRAEALERQTHSYSQMQALYDKRIKLESEPWPEFDGVEIDAKRQINLALIALAQYFFMSTTELGLGLKAFKARHNKPWNKNYGTEAECQAVMLKVNQKLELFARMNDLGSEIKTRVAKLQEDVVYSTDTQTLPDEETITKVVNDLSGINFTASLADIDMEINVLKDNYWDIQDLLVPEEFVKDN